MEQVVNLGGAVTGFHIAGRHIDCMCGKELLKIDKRSGDILLKREIFEKEGFSRKLMGDDKQIFIYDFCTFYVFNQEDYEPLGKWRFGVDLRSDICGMAADENTVYCSIRKGKLIALDRRSHSAREFQISESSMWSLRTYGKYLVCGTVDGRLLLLDKASLSIERALVLGKKNIGSLYLDGETLYAASQDGKLFKINLESFAIEALRKNAHKKMFHCVGIYHDMLVTISYPCSETALWDTNTLEKVKTVQVPLQLSGCAHIEDGSLYLSSRNIPGIGRLSLDG